MNRLTDAKRAAVVATLVEGNSIRTTVRMTGVANNTVVKLLVDLGAACARYQDETLRNLSCRWLRCDEIWSFVGAKDKNVPADKAGKCGMGSVWTWTAIDADTKLVPSFLVGTRDLGSAYTFICDWHASHYVKVMLDQVLGEDQFINEIVWKRQTSHNDARQGSKHYGRLHDTLLFYCGGRAPYTWNQQYTTLDQSYVDSHYSQVDERGRRFQWGDLRAPGGAAPSKGNPHYMMMARADRTKGFFVSFDYSSDALTEIDAFFRKSGRIIIPLTVREILDEQIARKLA